MGYEGVDAGLRRGANVVYMLTLALKRKANRGCLSNALRLTLVMVEGYYLVPSRPVVVCCETAVKIALCR